MSSTMRRWPKTSKKELRQIVRESDEDGWPRYRLDPVFTGVDPRSEFQNAGEDAMLSDATPAIDHGLPGKR